MFKRILLAVLFIVWVFSQSVLAETEFWSINTFQLPVREKIKFNVIPELRFRNNGGELYYSQTYVGPVFLLSRNIEIDLYYAPNFTKNGGSWVSKGLGYLDAIYRTDFPWFIFSNRGRFEYDFTPSVLKYRNLFWFGRDGWFASDELFYDFKLGFFDEGRSAIGYSAKILGNIDLSLNFLLRRQRQGSTADWQRTNVINLGLKVNI